MILMIWMIKEQMICCQKMMLDAKKGSITSQRVSAITGINENVYFYMAGLKPNSSRLSLKFIYKKKLLIFCII